MPYAIVDPDDLEAIRPPFMQDVPDLKLNGNHQAVEEIIKMVKALKELGLECGFTKKLKSLPLFELRTHSRGGNKGGVRIYFSKLLTLHLCSVVPNGNKVIKSIKLYSRIVLTCF
jgi:hypothetical protein